MNIPTGFPLLGHHITVNQVKPEHWAHGEDSVGVWMPQNHTIELRTDYDGTRLEQTFFHELMHAALDMMGHKFARDEQFVDQLSGLLHQALAGAVFKKKRK